MHSPWKLQAFIVSKFILSIFRQTLLFIEEVINIEQFIYRKQLIERYDRAFSLCEYLFSFFFFFFFFFFFISTASNYVQFIMFWSSLTRLYC
jgi:hypothetical protein